MAATPKPIAPRKAAVQSRSRRTVEWILEGAARVFRAEGFAATTNRIAETAGVSIGTLYEYFPNKEALLVALATQHVETAEREIAAALQHGGSMRERLAALQAAIVGSQRYPSQAIDLVSEANVAAALGGRVQLLRATVLSALTEWARARNQPEPELRARAVFGVIAELSSRNAYDAPSDREGAALALHWLEMAVTHLGA